MRHFLPAFVLTAGLFCLMPVAARAQEGDALARYEIEKKNEIVAGALEWLVPIVGHHYAGNARAGYVPAAVSGGGLVGVIVGSTLSSNCYSAGGVEICQSGNGTVVALGWLTYLGGRVWGIVSALDVARQFNRDLADRLGVGLDDVDLVVAPTPTGMSVGLSFPFGR